ncbi:MAG: 2-succinyl-6-hydroxy-2,4-cyclohexadiene-1-carboxylate synthase [Chloroflexi bacterium]|nr:2-succinyl-6-hydroxy-2,4-cyclohexadiene-1-carboxylate synthase [Chloroflexota bacterium]
MALLRVNGVDLNVRVAGRGPAVVALHGFTGDLGTWRAFARAAPADNTVILVDLLGHGRSTCPTDPDRYRMERTVADLVGVLDALGIQRAAWLGYSMGGRIALGVGVLAPERCRGLVLEGASPGLPTAEERTQRAASDELLAQSIERHGLATFVDYWERLPLFASQARLTGRVRARLRAQRLRNNPAGLAASLRGIGTGAQPAFHDRLAGLALPVLFLAGEEDLKFRQIAQEMGAAVPAGRVAFIPRAGHAAHLEQPAAFNCAVLDFLRSLPADEPGQGAATLPAGPAR